MFVLYSFGIGIGTTPAAPGAALLALL